MDNPIVWVYTICLPRDDHILTLLIILSHRDFLSGLNLYFSYSCFITLTNSLNYYPFYCHNFLGACMVMHDYRGWKHVCVPHLTAWHLFALLWDDLLLNLFTVVISSICTTLFFGRSHPVVLLSGSSI